MFQNLNQIRYEYFEQTTSKPDKLKLNCPRAFVVWPDSVRRTIGLFWNAHKLVLSVLNLMIKLI